MSTHKRFGLVIQGPITSFGRGGDRAHIPLAELGQEGLVRFDCRKSIKKIIERYQDLFEVILISTWDGEIGADDDWNGAVFFSQPDPKGIVRAGTSMYSYKENNKYRQFISTYAGLLEVEKRAQVDYVIKMRTDQELDLRAMIEQFLERISHETVADECIFAPYFHEHTFLLHDYYFVSSLVAMKRFCEAVLAFDRFEFIDSVHREMVLKHAFVCYKEAIGVPDEAYFPRSPANGVAMDTKKIFTYMFQNVYRTFDPMVLRSVLWRGTRLSEEYVATRLRLQNKGKGSLYALPAWLSTDWDRYFEFKRLVQGYRITWANRCVAISGRHAWSAWQHFRRAIIWLRRLLGR